MNDVRKKPIIILTVVCAVVLIGAVAFMIGFVNPNLRYADAGSKMLKKDYYNAMLIYQDLGRYKDSETRYQVAEFYATSYDMEIEEFIAKALSLGLRVQVAVGEITPLPQEEEEREFVARPRISILYLSRPRRLRTRANNPYTRGQDLCGLEGRIQLLRNARVQQLYIHGDSRRRLRLYQIVTVVAIVLL